jgi:hypothetical protein
MTRFCLPAIIVAFPVMLAGSAVAQQGSLVRTVADGKPWTMANTAGPGGQITLMPDGKGRMVMGAMTASPTWREGEKGELCLKPMLVMPERCATLQREGAAIVGLDKGQVKFRLTRP